MVGVQDAISSAVPTRRPDDRLADLVADEEAAPHPPEGLGQFDGYRRLALASTMLIYPVVTSIIIAQDADGTRASLGFAVVLAFSVCYGLTAYAAYTGSWRRSCVCFGIMTALFLVALPFARTGAFFLCAVLVAVATFFLGRRRAGPIALVAVLAALVVPVAVRPWHSGPGWLPAIIIVTTALIVNAFSETVRANQALIEARAEVARLASLSERARIARDLHDLLGHSLTAIVIKAEVARRIATAEGSASAREIDEVGRLSRQALAEVRAAVSGFRDVSLAMELARGRELLRASGITADLPTATDMVDTAHQELFGWVLREGLTNVARHARAGRCTVVLSTGSIEIVDDGLGSGEVTPGNGLSMLRERVESAGGTLEAGPAPDGGWRLRAQVGPGPVDS